MDACSERHHDSRWAARTTYPAVRQLKLYSFLPGVHRPVRDPRLPVEFGVSDQLTALRVSIYMSRYDLSTLFYGLLSDRWAGVASSIRLWRHRAAQGFNATLLTLQFGSGDMGSSNALSFTQLEAAYDP